MIFFFKYYLSLYISNNGSSQINDKAKISQSKIHLNSISGKYLVSNISLGIKKDVIMLLIKALLLRMNINNNKDGNTTIKDSKIEIL